METRWGTCRRWTFHKKPIWINRINPMYGGRPNMTYLWGNDVNMQYKTENGCCPIQKVPWYYHGIPWCTLVYYGSTMVCTDFTIVPQYVP